jgi:hypothetical protein
VSTKIYYAWKVPLGGLGEFINKARRQMFGTVIDAIRNIMNAIDAKTVETAKAKYIKRRSKNPHLKEEKPFSPKELSRLDQEIRLAIVMRAARDAHFSTVKDLLDFECGITFRIYKKHAYGFGWGNYPFLDAIKDIKPAMEYGYWNNTDRPDGISRAAWTARAKTWDKVFANPTHLILKPVSFEPSNLMAEQHIWDCIHPKAGDEWNLYVGRNILDEKSPRMAVDAAIKELEKHPVDKQVLEDLTAVLPRIPR